MAEYSGDEIEARIARAVAAAVGSQIAAAVAGRVGPQPAPRALVWREAWEPYKDENAERISSFNSDQSRWAHLDRHLGDKVVVETTTETLKDFRRARRGEFTARKTLTTAKTRNNEVELARRLARWLHRRGRIPLDPFATMTQGEIFEPVENVRRNVVEDDPAASLTLDQIIASADELDRALVLVAHSSGMRRGEIAKLEWDWIDRTPDRNGRPLRLIRIPPGISKGRKGKRKGRETWISVDALAALDAYRKTLPFPLQRRAIHVFVNARLGKGGRPGKHFGKPLHKDYLTERFERLREHSKAVGPSGFAWFHDLRRSFITLARRRNEDTSNIMKAVGQTTLSAFKRYDIHARKDVIATRDRVEAARDAELAALSAVRKGPHAAHVGESAPNTAQEKNKR